MTVHDKAPGRFRNTNAKARKRNGRREEFKFDSRSSSRFPLRFRAFAFALDFMGGRGIAEGQLVQQITRFGGLSG